MKNKEYLMEEICRLMDELRTNYPEVEMRLYCYSGSIKEDENGYTYTDVLDSYFTFN